MGSDLTVVNSARVSFDKESEWEFIENTTVLSVKDQKLIRYLANNHHWTPFSHVMITLREKVPIFVARQRFKHTVGFTYNEISRRYVDSSPEFYKPDVWRSRPEGTLKQGSGTECITYLEHDEHIVWDDRSSPRIMTPITKEYDSFLQYCHYLYGAMIKAGVAPEQARMCLPQAAYTEYYVTGSLAAWARAYKLRIDNHAQVEIQQLAKEWNRVIGDIVEIEHSWRELTK